MWKLFVAALGVAGAAKLVAILLAGGIGLACLGGGIAYVTGRWEGVSAEREAHERAALAEAARQHRANEQAREAATKSIEDFYASRERLEHQLEELRHAADRDPDAANCGLNPAGRMRLERIDAPPILGAAPAELRQPCRRPQKLPDGALTQAQVERHWGRDRASLVECRGRHQALTRFYADRDRRLSGR